MQEVGQLRYFILKKDERIHNYASIADAINKHQLWQSDEPIYCTYTVSAPQRYIHFLPLLTCPVFAVNESTKKIFDIYQSGIKYRGLGLGDTSKQSLRTYYFMRPPIVDCLSKRTEFYMNDSVKKLVLDQSKIEYDNVFTVKGVNGNYLIVSLIIVEALLAKKLNEFTFVEVECE